MPSARTAGSATRRSASKRCEGVTDANRAADDDVGIDARTMGELLDDAGPCHRLEVRARLAELDAVALDLTHAEALADELVQVDTAHRQLASRLARREADVLDDLGVDERQSLAGWRAFL